MIDKFLDFVILWFRHLFVPRRIEEVFCYMDCHNLDVWVRDERVYAHCKTCDIRYSTPMV